MAPKEKKRRSSHVPLVRRSRTPAARSTKMAAGMICISVSTAWDEKVGSRAAICAGLPCEGWISALSLRATMAMETTTQNQNPDRSHKGWRDVRGVRSCSMDASVSDLDDGTSQQSAIILQSECADVSI